jgi:DNA-binding IclR family transcriptional regulator
MAGNSGEPGRTVVSKAALILMTLAAGGGQTLSSLACQTHLPVSTVHRLIRELVKTPLVERKAGGEYWPGPALRTLANAVAEPTLHSYGPLAVDDLSAVLNMTVRLGVPENLRLCYVEKPPGLRPGTSFPNSARLPMHATALGKALLAFMPATFVRLVVSAGLPRYTAYTLTTVHELLHSLAKIRRHGIATCNRELHPGIHAIAVPVFAGGSVPICAMEVLVPDLSESTLMHVTPALIVTARRLSRELATPRGRASQAPLHRTDDHHGERRPQRGRNEEERCARNRLIAVHDTGLLSSAVGSAV